jgi:hypothetical protein
VCSVQEQSGMECHGSIPPKWIGSVLVFGQDQKRVMEWFRSMFGWAKKVEWNGSVLCLCAFSKKGDNIIEGEKV